MKVMERTEKVNAVRENGMIPGIMYGHDSEPQSVQVEYKEFQKAWKEYGNTKTFKIQIDKKQHIVYIKDVQVEPMKHQILHFDFIKVKATDKIHAEIPVVFEGREKIDARGLVLDIQHENVSVEFTVGKGVSHFTLDVSTMDIRDHKYIEDIIIDDDIKVLDDPKTIVCQVYKPAMVKEVLPEDEETEGIEEGEETEENKVVEE